MSILLPKRPWTRQPPEGVPIDWGHRIASKLDVVSVPVGNVVRNWVKADKHQAFGKSTNLANAYTTVGEEGRATDTTTDSTSVFRLHDTHVNGDSDNVWYRPTTKITFFALIERRGTQTGNAPIYGVLDPAAAPYMTYHVMANQSATSSFRVGVSTGASTYIETADHALTANRPTFLVARVDGSNLELWIDGVKTTDSVSFSGTITAPATTTCGPAIGNFWDYTSDSRSWPGLVYLTGMSQEALTNAEIEELSVNPWQIFQPLPARFGGSPGAGTPSPISGTLGVTEALDTLASSAKVIVSGSLAETEAVDTLASSAKVIVSGSLAETEAVDTLASSAKVIVSGSLAETEAADTLAASGKVNIAGSLAITEAADTLSSSGVVSVAGTLAVTEAADTLNADGTVGSAISGELAVTEAVDTLAASGKVNIAGTLAVTEAADTLAAAGTLIASGTLAVTEDADTIAATGKVTVSGTLAITEAADTSSAIGKITVSGTVAVTEAADTLAASGVVNIAGTLAVTEEADTLSASGTVPFDIAGTVEVTEADDTLSASGSALIVALKINGVTIQ